jgi:Raf kinase inhibitor-like YbhB/YbcL family protein
MAMAFRLTSSAFDHNAAIPRRYTCDGENLSPAFEWDDPPPGTRSFVFLCDDPDAPSGTFRHWAVFDIPADQRRLAEGPQAATTPVEGMRQAVNDFGRVGYGGPCPPRGHGTHHYHFRLLALDVERLSVDPRPTCRAVAEAAQEHTFGTAELVGLFQR